MKISLDNVININIVIRVGDSTCTVGITEDLTGLGADGDIMVFVKVRETYDLQTVKNKMTVIAIHTPKPAIIQRNYPGLLMQCKAYRPFSCDVRLACASVQPLDPLGVGTETGDVAPEDVFNPILFKAMSNFGMSQLEARINAMSLDPVGSGVDVDGDTAMVDVDSVTPEVDEFNIYYALLANTHEWKHASAQSGFSMTGLKPLVYEMLYNVGDNSGNLTVDGQFFAPNNNGDASLFYSKAVRGNGKPMPFINCTSYTYSDVTKIDDNVKDLADDPKAPAGYAQSGFPSMPYNAELITPWLNCVVGTVIVPPSRLHTLFFRMVVEWTLEFSSIRPLSDITNYSGLIGTGNAQHYQNYSYSSVKEALTGSSDTILKNDSCMVSSTSGIKKVM